MERSSPRRWQAAALLLAPSVLMLTSGCAPSDKDMWHGYYYGNVLSAAPARISGPYASAPQCIAAMHAMLRAAPATASYSCGRGCRKSANGLTSNCAEVAR